MYLFFPYIILSIISFITLIIMAAYGVYKGYKLGANEFVFAMLASAWWVFCQAFELMALTLPVKLFWANMLYIGAGLSPFAFFLLVLRYTGQDRFITRKNITIILLIYFIFFFFIFTDHYFGLMRTNFSLDTSTIPYVIDKDFGMLFPLYMLFVHSMSMISIVLLIITAIQKQSIYRKQAVILLISLSLIAFSNLIHIFGLSPSTRFELTPALFGFSAVFISFGIFQHRLLDLTPIARDLLVERINSGIIVIDINSRVVEINSRALEFFALGKSKILGKKSNEIPGLREYIDSSLAKVNSREIVHSFNGKQLIHEVSYYQLLDKKDFLVGYLLIINDVTEKKKNEEQNIRQEKAISIMRERERVGRELHDGLAQVFGFYNAQAQAIKEYLNRGEYQPAQQQLEKLITVAQDQHVEIRSHITGIRGISVVNKSFSSALKKHINTFSEQHNIPITINFSNNLPEGFPEENCGVELSKIIQESLNNIQKHAGNCRVSISFDKKQDLIELMINDTGKGFNPEATGSGGYGLEIMRERAAFIGASLAIESELGKGTTIILTIGDCDDHENNNCR